MCIGIINVYNWRLQEQVIQKLETSASLTSPRRKAVRIAQNKVEFVRVDVNLADSIVIVVDEVHFRQLLSVLSVDHV